MVTLSESNNSECSSTTPQIGTDREHFGSNIVSSTNSERDFASAAHAAAAAHRGPSPYPHIGGASPYGPPMPPRHWGLPGAPGASFKPYGPIPMGYQLATDPLTGQILLIPTGNFYKICDKCGKGTYIDFVCFHRIKYDFFDKMRLYKISL